MDEATRQLLQQLGISLALGLLVGLQRQHSATALAGLRTFPLITLTGTLAAAVDGAAAAGGWVIAAGFLGLAVTIAITNYRRLENEEADPGTTTLVAALLMFTVGAYLVLGSALVAIAVGVGVAVLLQFKPELHGLAARLGDEDLRAIMTFALITCIILPILPNTTYELLSPFNVLNPFEIWLMVVLIVGISLGGYLVYRFFGERAGILLGGILGGAISSTATTLSYARRAAHEVNATRLAALVIGIASVVVGIRVLIEIAVVAPAHLVSLGVPVVVMMAAGAVATGFLWFGRPKQADQMPVQKNPAELRSAVAFGLLYAAVLMALAAAKNYVGNQALYAIAALSGLTDMDAITLSTARMVQAGEEGAGLAASDGWRLIVVATMSNLLFKTCLAAMVGHRRLAGQAAFLLGVPFVTGGLLLWLWPY
jgi:uncharacterized membrane protein (DUF4010 family)